MQNLAGHPDPDPLCQAELEAAGIACERLPECVRDRRGEVRTIVVGALRGWMFTRAWCYWRAEGPGLPCDVATTLHATHGTEVRVDGHCRCPSPVEWFQGLGVGRYHVDTPAGLRALADAIKAVVDDAQSDGPAKRRKREDRLLAACRSAEDYLRRAYERENGLEGEPAVLVELRAALREFS